VLESFLVRSGEMLRCLITPSTIDLSHVINHGVRNKPLIASVPCELLKLWERSSVSRARGLWRRGKGKPKATSAESRIGQSRVKMND
jgi:hypothetical protein